MKVLNIREDQVEKAVRVLVNAFADDHTFVYMYKSKKNYEKYAPRFFLSSVKWAMKHGMALMSEDENGVALLKKMGVSEMSYIDTIKTGIYPKLSQFGGLGVLRRYFFNIIPVCGQKHFSIMQKDSYWHGWLFAVNPGRRGAGNFIMKHVFEITDKEKIPIFLETTVERNVTLYSHNLFALKDEVYFKKGKFKFYFLLRPAQESKDA